MSEDRRDAQNRGTLLRFACLLGLCVFLASLVDQALFAAMLSQITFLASFSCALAAALRGQGVRADHLTFWDAAAAFYLVSMTAGAFVDVEAARQALESMRDGG